MLKIYLPKKEDSLYTKGRFISSYSPSVDYDNISGYELGEMVAEYAKHPSAYLRDKVAKNKHVSPETLNEIINYKPSVIDRIFYKKDSWFDDVIPEESVARHPNVILGDLNELVVHKERSVRLTAADSISKRLLTKKFIEDAFDRDIEETHPMSDSKFSYKRQEELSEYKNISAFFLLFKDNDVYRSLNRKLIDNPPNINASVFAVGEYKDFMDLKEKGIPQKTINFLKKTPGGLSVLEEYKELREQTTLSPDQVFSSLLSRFQDPKSSRNYIRENYNKIVSSLGVEFMDEYPELKRALLINRNTPEEIIVGELKNTIETPYLKMSNAKKNEIFSLVYSRPWVSKEMLYKLIEFLPAINELSERDVPFLTWPGSFPNEALLEKIINPYEKLLEHCITFSTDEIRESYSMIVEQKKEEIVSILEEENLSENLSGEKMNL